MFVYTTSVATNWTGLNAPELAVKFWRQVRKGSGCWIWTGLRNRKGYGRFRGGGAHRFAWALEHGKRPAQWILHRCDNPSCVRPSHLYQGNASRNSLDMYERGRDTQHNNVRRNAKLSPEKIQALLKEYDNASQDVLPGAITQKTLAKKYGVTVRMVCGIVNGQMWKRHAGASTLTTRESRQKRRPRGTANGRAKLTDVIVKAMRVAYYSDVPETLTALSAKYGVTRYAAWRAITGDTWKHVK